MAGGDVNSDGRADLIVAAGYLGGTRVAGWNGAALAQGIPERVFSDFFAFESTLRTGLYITAGDIDDDGRADLIVGGGQVAGPRVTIFSGAQLASSNEPVELANFFANDPAARSEVRVGVKELNGNGRVDVTAGLSGVVRSHVIDPLAATATPDPF